MKLPDWICRLAFGSLQFGQSFSAFSVMRWTRSNSWPQFSHVMSKEQTNFSCLFGYFLATNFATSPRLKELCERQKISLS